ncbi:hypothetical protein [Croceicoccus mobilis]|uniref:Uncharacterized protein n=1 Tax=Croceicoccus mobilis TaxID=1703339 RepID=A0A917DZC9_9SPHN|nr:hypothetical protein [Croceicoccus mobilis]GGD84652.1 hypothetical protein GCM10010990_38370 [Croceicoccus mobilis]
MKSTCADMGPAAMTEVTCDHTGTAFPVGYDMLQSGGAPELTRLFHAIGTLEPENRVERITRWEEFFGGGMGRKIVIDVEYAQPTDRPTRLFAKFTREMGDPLQALFSPVMDPEVRFALLSRRSDFPLIVPECMFAGYSAEYLTGLLITGRVPYGENGVLPVMEKAVDHEYGELLPVYEAQTRAMAKLAGFHRAGRFGGEVTETFPFDRTNEALLKVIPFGSEELDAKLDRLHRFAARAPQLLPDGLSDPAFLDSFARGARMVLRKERAIWHAIYAHDDAIALIHWNMNPDNAWFWRDATGEMQSGQLDWGGVGQGNLAQGYYGMYCAAETDFIARHDAALQDLLLSEYARGGGPALDPARFDRDISLAIAVLGSAWMLDAPALIEAEIPDFETLKGRDDPRLRALFIPRAQLQLMRLFLSEWRRKDIGAIVDAI